MDKFDIGDVIRINATFTNSGGTLVDPSSYSLKYRRHLDGPNSATTVGSLVRASTGLYYADVDTSALEEGEYHFRWRGFGANAAAAEGRFKLRWNSVD